MNRLSFEEGLALLAPALADPHPILSVQDLAQQLVERRAFLWTGERSCVFVRIWDASTGERVCEAAPAAGDLNEIVERAVPEIEAWARENNCTQGQIIAGRSGWERALAGHGYELTAITLRKVF